jgi:hypothetical protein
VAALEALIGIVGVKVGRHVQKAQSDRGKEFDHVGIQRLFAARGIEQQLTVGPGPDSYKRTMVIMDLGERELGQVSSVSSAVSPCFEVLRK